MNIMMITNKYKILFLIFFVIQCKNNEIKQTEYYTIDLQYMIQEKVILEDFNLVNKRVVYLEYKIYENKNWSESLIYSKFNTKKLDMLNDDYYMTEDVNKKIDMYLSNYRNKLIGIDNIIDNKINYILSNELNIEFNKGILVFYENTPFNYLNSKYEKREIKDEIMFDRLRIFTDTFQLIIPLKSDTINYRNSLL